MKNLPQNSIKNKLIAGFLFLVVLTGASSIFAGFRLINSGIIEQAYTTIRNDLHTAEYIYQNSFAGTEIVINYMSSLDSLAEAVNFRNRTVLRSIPGSIKSRVGADIVIITDDMGRVLLRANSEISGDQVDAIMCIKQVIDTKKPVSGSGIITREFLLKEGAEIARRAAVKIIPTEMGRELHGSMEERALVLNAAVPVFFRGRFAGVIYCASILNNNYEIVDRIRDTVFHPGTGREIYNGNATIFLNDIRISTNVLNDKGERSTGTQISSGVYEKVFKQGGVWVDRAFVVNRWFIAAYSPIKDTSGSVAGILYVGIPQASFDSIKNRTLGFFLLISLFTASCAIIISVYLIRRIVRPVNEVVAAMEDIACGNYREKLRAFREQELNRLSIAFNGMIDAIFERDRKIQESARNQIARSEKLASLGRLAAGIAHEINNPLTGVLTYGSMLREELKGTPHEEDLNTIVDETLRCKKIVREVLDFARETTLEMEFADINSVLNSTLSIVEKHVNFRKVNIKKNFAVNLPEVLIDVSQMKSVIDNLALNASDAMPDGGELVIETDYDEDERSILVRFRDNGTGIAEENRDKIFDPFFTTKEPGKGTGLGLAVIYGIIERHNGTISVTSTSGKGTEFIIKLPAGDHDTGNTEKNC